MTGTSIPCLRSVSVIRQQDNERTRPSCRYQYSSLPLKENPQPALLCQPDFDGMTDPTHLPMLGRALQRSHRRHVSATVVGQKHASSVSQGIAIIAIKSGWQGTPPLVSKVANSDMRSAVHTNVTTAYCVLGVNAPAYSLVVRRFASSSSQSRLSSFSVSICATATFPAPNQYQARHSPHDANRGDLDPAGVDFEWTRVTTQTLHLI